MYSKNSFNFIRFVSFYRIIITKYSCELTVVLQLLKYLSTGFIVKFWYLVLVLYILIGIQNKYMKKALTIGSVILSSVSIALAQVAAPTLYSATSVNTSSIEGLITRVSAIVTSIVPLFVGLALAGFFWFLVRFIWKGGSEPKEKQAALAGMGYSVLALFLIVGIWGIIAFIANMFGIGLGGSVPIPTIPGQVR